MTATHTKAPPLVDRVFNAVQTITRAYEDENGNRVIEGIATTPTEDRYGDVVDPMGVKFKLPLPLLWQHVPDHVVGNVVGAEVTPKGIAFRAIFAPANILSTIDQHWAELKAGLIRYVSVGFRSLKSSNTKTGLRFDEWEWLELSCVTIPANPDAGITSIRAFALPATDTPATFSRTTPAGTSAAHPVARTGNKPMGLKEKILARKARVAELRARIAELAELEEPTADEKRELDEAITACEAEVAELDQAERALGAIEAKARVVTTTGNTANTPNAPAVINNTNRTATRQREKGELLFRIAGAHLVAHVARRPVEQVLAELYPDDQHVRGFHDALLVRAASAPAMTTVPAWAGYLVQETWGEFLDLLRPVSVYGQLAPMGLRFTFGRFGKINVPSRLPTPNLAGDFIAEGAPIPVKQGAFASTPLTPKKLAVISTYTREMARGTGGQIQTIIRDAMIEDTAQVLDTRLLDNVAASAIRPAGLLNGVTPIPSSGATLEDVIADFRALIGALQAENGGRRIVFLANPQQALGLGLLTNAAGSFMFASALTANPTVLGYTMIVSNNVPAGTLIAVDVADFATVADDSPQFDVSEQATLHMEDTTPLPIVDGTPASPVRSLFQTDTVGLRMIQQMDWLMRRPDMVAAVTGITW